MEESLKEKIRKNICFDSIFELCDSIAAIAPLVGKPGNDALDYSAISRLTDPKVRDFKYHTFEIPKKSGGVRHIIAPTGNLMTIQRILAVMLTIGYGSEGPAHGFVMGRSVVTNAENHLHRNYVLNLDLKDFFPSVTASRVAAGLKRQGISERVAWFITRLCTRTVLDDDIPEEVLPQGAPTSPILSNIACDMMDLRLEGLADRFGLHYTRYADDITFSSHHSVYAKDSIFWKELEDIISANGFRINPAKTRLQKKGSRQEVTGLTVGDKVNVSRKWLKNLRAQIFQMEMHGASKLEFRRVMGKIAFLSMVRDNDDLCQRMRERAIWAYRMIPMHEQHWLPRHNQYAVCEHGIDYEPLDDPFMFSDFGSCSIPF